jgi:hypothetical protein
MTSKVFKNLSDRVDRLFVENGHLSSDLLDLKKEFLQSRREIDKIKDYLLEYYIPKPRFKVGDKVLLVYSHLTYGQKVTGIITEVRGRNRDYLTSKIQYKVLTSYGTKDVFEEGLTRATDSFCERIKNLFRR